MNNPLIALLVVGLLTAVGWLIFWPERGFFWRWQRAGHVTRRILSEDALKHMQRCENEGRRSTVQSIAGALQVTGDEAAELLVDMEARNLLRHDDGELALTASGRAYALHIIRAHRLWERYLSDNTGFAEAEWHDRAERFEHELSLEAADALSAQLGNPTHDPHGDPIPTAGGELVSHGGRPLPAMSLNNPGRIVHLEDEPEAVYAQLVAEGLYPGMAVRLTEISPQRVRFWADGDEHVLAPIVAANISVVPATNGQARAIPGEPLSSLKSGERAKVVSLSWACRGAERRRLMDLGILPGTLIEAELTAPSGDPTAYRVRGALIALRHEQADWIRVVHPEDAAL